jgi:hypothetical protein
MMKAVFLCLLVGFLTLRLGAEEKKSMSRQEAITELEKRVYDRGNASELQYDAFRELVRQGPEGWESLFRIQLRSDFLGDAARRIDSFWELRDIPLEHFERFQAAQGAEIARHSVNETWALLYASAYERTAKRPGRLEDYQKKLDRHFSRLETSAGEPAKALLEVAFLRIHLVDNNEFPGHRFPWTEKPEKQKAALQGLLDWWKKHRDDFKPEEE